MYEKMLRIKDICRKYEIGRYSVDKAVRNGMLTAYRPNSRDYRFKESDVERWIGSTQVNADKLCRSRIG